MSLSFSFNQIFKLKFLISFFQLYCYLKIYIILYSQYHDLMNPVAIVYYINQVSFANAKYKWIYSKFHETLWAREICDVRF